MDLAKTLLAGLGVNVGDVQAALQNAGAEYEAFKTGFRAAMSHFSGEIAAIRKENAAIRDDLARLIAAVEIRDFEGRSELIAFPTDEKDAA